MLIKVKTIELILILQIITKAVFLGVITQFFLPYPFMCFFHKNAYLCAMKRKSGFSTDNLLVFIQWRNKAFALFASIGKKIIIAAISYNITQALIKNNFNPVFNWIIFLFKLKVTYCCAKILLNNINIKSIQNNSFSIFTNINNHIKPVNVIFSGFFYFSPHE